MSIPFVDWPVIGSHFLSLAIAFVLALPVGWERERHERTPALRTFPLVAVASCGYALLAERELAGSLDAQARIIQGMCQNSVHSGFAD